MKPALYKLLVFFILFFLGVKGGSYLENNQGIDAWQSALLCFVLIFWGFLQPGISFYVLRKYLKIETATASVIAACFGSVSVTTFLSAEFFLQSLGVTYNGIVTSILPIMEIPAIISGLLLVKLFGEERNNAYTNGVMNKFVKEIFFNVPVIAIVAGLFFGFFNTKMDLLPLDKVFLVSKGLVCLFLFELGYRVYSYRDDFKSIGWKLKLFGIFTPLLGGLVGVIISSVFSLDTGTATLVTVLLASASYIAVPAAMRTCVPSAKEGIYVPLSIAIAFPFNIILGIPLYYLLILRLLP